MSHFDGKRRAFCVRAFYENSRSYVVVRRLFCSEYGVRQIREAPSANLIKIWIKRFEETGSTFKPHAKVVHAHVGPKTSCTSSSNIEKTKELLGKLEQAKIEALREQKLKMSALEPTPSPSQSRPPKQSELFLWSMKKKKKGHTSNYVWMDKDIQSCRQAFLSGLSTGLKNPQKGKRLIITHIGSDDGFLEGAEWIFEAKKNRRRG
ncbi:hypothetical protein ACJJTC_010518 [Scirpophaga incertulas]